MLRQRARHKLVWIVNATLSTVRLHEFCGALPSTATALHLRIHDRHEVAFLADARCLRTLDASFTYPATNVTCRWFSGRVNAAVTRGLIACHAILLHEVSSIIGLFESLIVRHRYIREDVDITFHVKL